MKKLILAIQILFFATSCFYHPLWKPYFFDVKDDSSKYFLIFGTAFLLIQSSTVKISSISKTSGVEGDTLVINGENFSTSKENNTVIFSGSIVAEIVSASETSLSVTVPIGAKSGSIQVNNSFSSAQSSDSFTVYRYFITFSAGANTETYSLDFNTGAVNPISGSPYALNIPLGAKFELQGKFAFSGVFGLTNITSYLVNSQNGSISVLNSNAGATGNDPIFFAFHPNGNFLYVSSVASASIAAFQLDNQTGNLIKINDYSQSCSCSFNHLAISPNGKFLYVNGNGGPEPIVGFSIDQTTGVLTNVVGSPFNIGVANLEALLIDNTSKYLYSVAGSNDSIIGWQIDSNTGNLAVMPGSPFPGTIGNFRAVMHPSGKYLYTVNIANVTLAKHDISSLDGSLSTPNSTITFGANLQFVTLDPTGNFGFVSNVSGGNSFFVFQVDATTGAPTLLNSGNPYTASGAANTVPEPYRIAQ